MSDEVPPDEPLPTRTEAEGATLDLPEGVRMFTSGQVLGDRYQILEMLGKGGIGEVWRAFDLKLRVEVALKALREDLFKDERRLEMLRQEVRAAREVVSPNVCRIYDLEEAEGRELVSMEYIDGATLLDVLQERGPLELKEAQDIASQFLAGLEAIHQAGLVHRDVKPENIMLTRAGRVVVMDFGLARQETEGGGSVSGTPAYMAPEQAAGLKVDARADVYSAGVVLAEMVSPDGIKSFESRQSIWEGVRSEPAKVPDTPWAPVVRKAVKKNREERYNSAHTLTRALEDVTLRVEGAEDLHPYPGLASFTESDAEYFFGREAEVEQMWRKLEGPPRMLALAGPSGAGKSSFLRAGLLAKKGPGWGHVICTPGNDPFASLRRAVISELEGDGDALRELATGSEDASVSAVARWRRHHEHAVVVVDQFEELFTQNPADAQRRFATLLRRLAVEADVFVLASLRDDFLFYCHQHEPLRPVLSGLTMLGPPEGAALRRALVQPAMTCGYRFEDDDLVDEMLAEVEGERGALPLLAFAVSRLWEKRDRENGLLTRQAYHDIGGVGGALARHAEATVDVIGHERLPIVRELFRNLVTADGTRVRPENPHCEMVCLFLSKVSASGHMVSFNDCEDENWEYVLWSMPEGRALGTIRYARRFSWADAEDRQRRVVSGLKDGHASIDALGFDGTVKHLGTLELESVSPRNLQLDRRDGRWLAVVVDNEVRIIEIGDDGLSEPRRLYRAVRGVAALDARGQWLAAVIDDEVLAFDLGGDRPTEPRHLGRARDVTKLAIDPLARFVATFHANSTIRLWSLTEKAPPLILEGPQGVDQMIRFNDDGSLMDVWAGVDDEWNVRIWNLSGPSPRFVRGFDVGKGYLDMDPAGKNAVEWGTDHRTLVWPMDAPADAEPLVLQTGGEMVRRASFDPDGRWLATAGGALAVWPLAKPYPSVIRRHDQAIWGLKFAPDGSWLASASADGTVKLWPLVGDPPPPGRTLLQLDGKIQFLAVSPDGSRILAGSSREGVWVLRPDGKDPSHLGGFRDFVGGLAFSADGRLAAAAGGEAELAERVIRVWDMETEKEVTVLDVGEQVWPDSIAFTPDGHLLSSSESGLLRWDVATGEREVLYEGEFHWFSASADGRRVLLVEGTQEADDWGRAVLLDLESGTVTRLDGFGGDMRLPVLDPTGTLVVNGNGDGEIMVGRTDGSEPHLLLGHEGAANHVAIDPLGRWIASGGSDKTVRLWPMPDLDKPPLHTLPREELIAKLKTLTNLRAVRDEESSTGWKIEVGPFPGWETVPTW